PARPACRPPAARRGTPGPRGRTSAESCSSAVLELVPARRRQQLEQRAAAVGIAVGEIRDLLVEANLELPVLDPVVEPGPAEHELLQPVHERLAVDEGDLVPVANEVPAERAAGLLDRVPLHELDQVGRLVVVELVASEEAELDGCRRDALLEVLGVEAEAVPEELDDVVVAGVVVAGPVHGSKRTLGPCGRSVFRSPSWPSPSWSRARPGGWGGRSSGRSISPR